MRTDPLENIQGWRGPPLVERRRIDEQVTVSILREDERIACVGFLLLHEMAARHFEYVHATFDYAPEGHLYTGAPSEQRLFRVVLHASMSVGATNWMHTAWKQAGGLGQRLLPTVTTNWLAPNRAISGPAAAYVRLPVHSFLRPASRTVLVDSASEMRAALDRAVATDSRELLGTVTTELLDFGDDSDARRAFAEWILARGTTSVRRRAIGLAAVVEAGSRLGITETATLATAILELNATIPIATGIAAQRIRLLPLNDELRDRLAVALPATIRRLIASGDLNGALAAIPSLLPALGHRAVATIVELLRNSDARYAWAASQSILQWASSTDVVPEDSSRLLATVIERLRDEQTAPAGTPDLRASLIWALGSLASASDLDDVAQELAMAFGSPAGIEDAAAVRAGRRLIRVFGDRAIGSIVRVFQRNPAELSRFLGLILAPGGTTGNGTAATSSG